MMKFLNKYPTEVTAFFVTVALAFMLTLSGCSALGVPAADTFNKKVVAGYAAVTTVAETATVLLKSGKISKDDAKNVHAGNQKALIAIDQAVLLHKTSPVAAEDKLTLAIQGLSALQAFLASRQKE